MSARKIYEACPICGSDSFKLLGRADCSSHALYDKRLPSTINWQLCAACGHIFTDGYFEGEYLEYMLSNSHALQMHNPEFVERERGLSAVVIDKVSGYLGRQHGRWLDVGFGNGSLLTTCAEYGFDPIGIDLRRQAVDELKKYGYDVRCMDLVECSSSDLVSVISMADVLEHLPYPSKALSQAYKLLEPGGVLFVSCPNSEAHLWKLLTSKKQNPYWMELEHYHNFGRSRLSALLEEHGFRPVSYGVSQRYRVGMEIIAVRP